MPFSTKLKQSLERSERFVIGIYSNISPRSIDKHVKVWRGLPVVELCN